MVCCGKVCCGGQFNCMLWNGLLLWAINCVFGWCVVVGSKFYVVGWCAVSTDSLEKSNGCCFSIWQSSVCIIREDLILQFMLNGHCVKSSWNVLLIEKSSD
jgi:hypothetical protein